MVDLVAMRPYMIAAILVIAVIGYWNQRRMIRKKNNELIEGTMYSPSSNTYSNPDAEFIVNNEIDEKSKAYIEQYKSSYPKESLEQGLLNFGVTPEEAKKLVEKYYN